MIEQWQELKETITELRDSNGTGTQQEVCKFFVNYMDVLEKQMQEPCDDAISRQAVLNLFNKSDNYSWEMSWLKRKIEKIPSVKPQEPKTGRWEWVQYDNNPNIGNWHCSKCNRIVSGAITAVNPIYSYKYCPQCGARMERSDKECLD